MINDTDVILPANTTSSNATEVQEDNENEEDTLDHVGTAENSTTAAEEPTPNATLPEPSSSNSPSSMATTTSD